MKTLRRIVQSIFLLLFFYLFFLTNFPLSTPVPASIFFKMDPLIAIISLISSYKISSTFILALCIFIATIFMGRIFCGWICPMGTFLDIFNALITKWFLKCLRKRKTSSIKNLKFYILAGIFSSFLLGFQIIWLLDPISLFSRTLSTGFYPLLSAFIEKIGNSINFIPEYISSRFSTETKLNFEIITPVITIFILILLLEFYSRRFWCKVLCPLGAFYSLAGHFKLLRRITSSSCTGCGDCSKTCKMEAIDTNDHRRTDNNECILCFSCTKSCKQGATKIGFKSKPQPTPYDTNRRSFLLWIAGGVTAGYAGVNFSNTFSRNHQILRPPGAIKESLFLDSCIRCHECIKICMSSGNFLQPCGFESGLEGFWTPRGVAKDGWCEYECNLCTLVCPSGAIKPLDIETKKKTKIGLAQIDKSRCLPWKKNEECFVCEEHCPTPQKAIQLDEMEVFISDSEKLKIKRPSVNKNLCIGCGICEAKCPVEGEKGIKIKPIL